MTAPEDPNPYVSPTVEGGGKAPVGKRSALLWLFVVPFFLAHLVFWPTFAAGLYVSSGQDYGITAIFFGTGAIVIAGLVYGGVIGMESPDNTPVSGGRLAMCIIGQAFWFVFAVFAPCAFVAGV